MRRYERTRFDGRALRMAAAVRERASTPMADLYYEGQAGRIIDRGKEWWPQAEAVVGFLNAFELSGDVNYLEAARASLEVHATQHLVDRVHGEWFWRIDADGRPDPTLPKVSEWKGPYHVAPSVPGNHAPVKALRSHVESDRSIE